MGILIMIGQLFLSLSLLIVLHECGHFLPAKWFNTRVEKFYLFFDPWFSLFKVKKGETEYGIGWLPLGGYVKIAGMVDESMDMDQMQQPEQPWEFRAKPTWQRLIIMLGGVIVNFILGYFIWGLVIYGYGKEYIPTANVTTGIYADSLGLEMGLQHGDHILKIGDFKFEKFNEGLFRKEIAINSANTITVHRNGENKILPVDKKFINTVVSNKYKNYPIFHANFPWKVSGFGKNSPAEKAGLKVGDIILSLNGESAPHFTDVFRIVKKNKGKNITTVVDRNGETLEFNVDMKDSDLMGIARFGPDEFFTSVKETFSFGESMKLGVVEGTDLIFTQLKAFAQIGRGNLKAKDTMGGFASFAKMFPREWNWQRFWHNTALISLILAFMNILPIPALDGGHVMFLLYEMVTGRKPSDTFLQYATLVGFVIVLSLLVYVNGLDILRAWRGE